MQRAGKVPIEYVKGGNIPHDVRIPEAKNYSAKMGGAVWERIAPESQVALLNRGDVRAIVARMQWLHGKGELPVEVEELVATDLQGQKHEFYLLKTQTVDPRVKEQYIVPKELSPEMEAKLNAKDGKWDREDFVTVTPWAEMRDKGLVDPQGKGTVIPFGPGHATEDLIEATRYITLNKMLADYFPPQTFVQLNPYHVIYRESNRDERSAVVRVERAVGDVLDNAVKEHVAGLFEGAERDRMLQMINHTTVFIHFRPPDTPAGGTVWVIGGMGHVGAEAATYELRRNLSRRKRREHTITEAPYLEATAREEGIEELVGERRVWGVTRPVPFYSPRNISRALGVVSSGEHGQTTANHLGVPRAVWLPKTDSTMLDPEAGEGKVSAMIPYKLLLGWRLGVFQEAQGGQIATSEEGWRAFTDYLSNQSGITQEALVNLPRQIDLPPMSILDERVALRAAVEMRKEGGLLRSWIRSLRRPSIPDMLMVVEAAKLV